MLSSTRLRTTLLCLPVFLLCFRRPFPIQIRAQFTRGTPARQQPFWAEPRFFQASGFGFQVPSSRRSNPKTYSLLPITYYFRVVALRCGAGCGQIPLPTCSFANRPGTSGRERSTLNARRSGLQRKNDLYSRSPNCPASTPSAPPHRSRSLLRAPVN